MPEFIPRPQLPTGLASQVLELIKQQQSANPLLGLISAGKDIGLGAIEGMAERKKMEMANQAEIRKLVSAFAEKGRIEKPSQGGAPTAGAIPFSELFQGLPAQPGLFVKPPQKADQVLDILKTGKFSLKKEVPEGTEITSKNFMDFFDVIPTTVVGPTGTVIREVKGRVETLPQKKEWTEEKAAAKSAEKLDRLIEQIEDNTRNTAKLAQDRLVFVANEAEKKRAFDQAFTETATRLVNTKLRDYPEKTRTEVLQKLLGEKAPEAVPPPAVPQPQGTVIPSPRAGSVDEKIIASAKAALARGATREQLETEFARKMAGADPTKIKYWLDAATK